MHAFLADRRACCQRAIFDCATAGDAKDPTKRGTRRCSTFRSARILI
jgi:hypothetical protein